jgi:hypothetical protein
MIEVIVGIIQIVIAATLLLALPLMVLAGCVAAIGAFFKVMELLTGG